MKKILMYVFIIACTLSLTACTGERDMNRDGLSYSTFGPITLAEANKAAVPEYYTAVELDGAAVTLYAFTDNQGAFQRRAYARQQIVDETGQERVAEGFIRVGINLLEDGSFELVPDAEEDAYLPAIAKPAQTEPFGQVVPESVPETISLSAGYIPLEEKAGAYVFENKEGKREYRVYGSFDGEEYRFWPAGADGRMIPGALYVDLERDIERMK